MIETKIMNETFLVMSKTEYLQGSLLTFIDGIVLMYLIFVLVEWVYKQIEKRKEFEKCLTDKQKIELYKQREFD